MNLVSLFLEAELRSERAVIRYQETVSLAYTGSHVGLPGFLS